MGPATSGNFSVQVDGRILITASGLDKGTLTPAGLLEVDANGNVLSGEGKPSAETSLHLVLYRARPDAGAILHVHTIWNTLISARNASLGYVPLEGYELLKGLSGVTTHAHLSACPSSRTRRTTPISLPSLPRLSKPTPRPTGFCSVVMGFILGDNRWPKPAAILRLSSFSFRSKSGVSWAGSRKSCRHVTPPIKY